ncbi:AraC family transcriptional regulator [Clostridium sp. MSJ-11]|uniref:AraC family transcriptional regulator n=2 Tax=Clostridium mobile TaxID=2841512 RepID=A0ABS6ELC1_9CLOT|nr:AraC family transcriptional regulator [Clostridium mobile]
MTNYELFDGVSLMYNDFHMHSCQSDLEVQSNLLCIDHCREGRIEHEIKDGVYAYTGAGDLKIDNRKHHKGNILLPLNHYHGITIYIDVDKARVSLKKEFPSFEIDVNQLQNKFCMNDEPYIISGVESIQHIFHELYAVPDKIRHPYMVLKVFELLLFLDALEKSNDQGEHPYFYKTQVEKVKAIHKLMTENMEEHYTLEELSKRFNISLTVMKTCFKNIYGDSIFSYMKTYKMNQAAVLLKMKKELSVSDIAGIVGYDSPGKFSTAFKSVMGMTPLVYRNNFV